MSCIQFTTDLPPSDITGTEVLFEVGGKQEFQFQPGPIFSNIILDDEINRAPAKVQAALLEDENGKGTGSTARRGMVLTGVPDSNCSFCSRNNITC